MSKFKTVALAVVSGLLLAMLWLGAGSQFRRSAMVSYEADPSQADIKLYWKDENNQRIKSLKNLKIGLDTQGQTLLFAMNAGMFNADYAPQGLFIQAGETITSLDTATGAGNFYLKPNGVFYLTTARTAHVCRTASFVNNGRVAYATQSGPMLVSDGKINPVFQSGSANLHIRNGVGILPNKRVLFAMSTEKINLFDFASYFKNAGCQNALYLDGFVSRAYAPAQNRMQADGDFGVMIGVTAPEQRSRPELPAN